MLWAIPHFSPLVVSGARSTLGVCVTALRLFVTNLAPWMFPGLIGTRVRRVVGQ